MHDALNRHFFYCHHVIDGVILFKAYVCLFALSTFPNSFWEVYNMKTQDYFLEIGLNNFSQLRGMMCEYFDLCSVCYQCCWQRERQSGRTTFDR